MFLSDIKPLAEEVGIGMVSATNRLQSIIRQTIGRGELGLAHILYVILGTAERYDLDIISSSYASSQYKVQCLVTLPQHNAVFLVVPI